MEVISLAERDGPVFAPVQHTEIRRKVLDHDETTNPADPSTRILWTRHPARPHGRVVHLSTNCSRLRRLVAVGASIRPRPETGAPVPVGAAPAVANGGRPLTTRTRKASHGSHAPTNLFSHGNPAKVMTMPTPHAPLPASLVEELVSLLAEALTADLTRVPPADARDCSSSSVVSSRGIPPKNALVRHR